MNKTLINAPDSIQTQLKDLGKALNDSIAKLELLYMQAADVKGIKRNPSDLMASLYTVSGYMDNINGTTSQMFTYSLAKARSQTETTLSQINVFIENDFNPYREKVEALNLSVFKEFEPLKIE